MKLYTEKQVDVMLSRARLHKQDDTEMFTNEYLISEETPIELPSDDDIARVGLEFSVGYNVEYWNGFKHCGEWMKEQILNQNK